MDNVVYSSRESIARARAEYEQAVDALEHAMAADDLTCEELAAVEKRALDAHDSWAELAYHTQ